MNVLTEPQVIKQGDKLAFAVIPWDVYQELVQNYVLDESDVWFPQEVVEASLLQFHNCVQCQGWNQGHTKNFGSWGHLCEADKAGDVSN